jgi:predicted dehydrogenase
MPTNKKYRVAVVGGAGTWGRHYLNAYANHPDCEIVALVDRARDRRQAFAEKCGIKVVYDTVEDLLKHDVPDIVSTILPVSISHDAVITCAEAGVKVVSCEKPMAAELARADEMVRVCRERGTAFGCGTAYWEIPHLLETVAWIKAGNIGNLTGASIPQGLPNEVSGGGCVQITMMRCLTGMEVEWVEGWTVPPEAAETENDCGAYGRFGLSDDIICEVPEPQQGSCPAAVSGDNGQVWLCRPMPVLIQGKGAAACPVHPDFLDNPLPQNWFTPVIERLMRAYDTGGEALCSGHDYRHALEVAIATKLSAKLGHKRVSLPLEDRSLKILPIPYRLYGGDVADWERGGYKGPPQVLV